MRSVCQLAQIPGEGAMTASVTNSRKTQPINPQNSRTLTDAFTWINSAHNDLYPQVQSLPQNVPSIVNLTNGTLTGGNIRQGREWTVSIVVNPTIGGPSVAAGASLTLPFVAALTSIFLVTFGTTVLPATVQQGSSTLVLPNWSTTQTVTIYGKACE